MPAGAGVLGGGIGGGTRGGGRAAGQARCQTWSARCWGCGRQLPAACQTWPSTWCKLLASVRTALAALRLRSPLRHPELYMRVVGLAFSHDAEEEHEWGGEEYWL